MTVSVRIIPSGHKFISEGRSTLLEAGLRSGLALGYGCSNGNCGECVARIVSGEVQKIRHHDYRMSDQKKTSGHVLMCSFAATSDVVIETNEADSVADIPRQQLTARVRAVVRVSESVALVHLKTPRTRRLRFLAGQYVRLGGNGMPTANYSIGSCPCDDMNLHFQVPMLAGQAFSEHVFRALKHGDLVAIDGPKGEFVLDEEARRDLVLIAWQTGFAPIRSLVEHAIALDNGAVVRLVWISPDGSGRYLENLCRSWQDALDDFEYIPINCGHDMGNVDWHGLFTSMSAADDRAFSEYDFYIAGNETVVKACRKVLLANGTSELRIKTDTLMHD